MNFNPHPLRKSMLHHEFIEPFLINPGYGFVYGRSFLVIFSKITSTINRPIARIYKERFDKLIPSVIIQSKFWLLIVFLEFQGEVLTLFCKTKHFLMNILDQKLKHIWNWSVFFTFLISSYSTNFLICNKCLLRLLPLKLWVRTPLKTNF
jgi:hypothetical protein